MRDLMYFEGFTSDDIESSADAAKADFIINRLDWDQDNEKHLREKRIAVLSNIATKNAMDHTLDNSIRNKFCDILEIITNLK